MLPPAVTILWDVMCQFDKYQSFGWNWCICHQGKRLRKVSIALLLFYPEDGGSRFVYNVGTCLHGVSYTVISITNAITVVCTKKKLTRMQINWVLFLILW
jgi:hypothetical protein